MSAPDHASFRELDALLSSASVEVSSRGHQLGGLRDHFPPATDVTITFLPGDNYRHNVETAVVLRRAGFNPVPHVAAREMPSLEALDDFLARLRGEADVTRILLVAGDVAAAKGPFKSSHDVRVSGSIEARGMARVSVAGHPEGHPYLAAAATFGGLEAWRDWGQQTRIRVDVVTQFCFESAPILGWIAELEARGMARVSVAGHPEGHPYLAAATFGGLEAWREWGQQTRIRVDVVTQFCFESAPILGWIAELEARRIELPVIVGLAGPASPATLTKFALRCGIGNSIRSLRGQIGRFGRLLADTGPDDVMRGLQSAPKTATASIAGFHLFPFGGLRKAAGWLRPYRAEMLGRLERTAPATGSQNP